MKRVAPALALAALLLSMWIVVPGPVLPLFILSVGGTELWPVLALIDGVALIVAFNSQGRLRAAATGASALALLCTLVPPASYVLRGPYVPLDAFLKKIPGDGEAAIATHRPVVFAIYGGAWQRGSIHNDGQFNAEVASWGYRVIPLDYPHAPQARWPAQIDEILREIDASGVGRAAIIGHSSGAQLALIAAALRPHRIAAVVTYESPVDLRLGYEHPSQPDVIHARRIISDLCGGVPEQQPACYRNASPRFAVRAGMPPVLMIAGARDHVANVVFERVLRDTMRNDGIRVTYVELPWADHAFETVWAGFHDRIALWYVHRFLDRLMKVDAAGQLRARNYMSMTGRTSIEP